MDIYINGISSISPQETFKTKDFLTNVIDCEKFYLEIVKPNYKAFIQPKQLRRMSKIIRMGVAAGKMALQDANLDNVDAIITGTGLGCVEDTEKFLNAIIDNKETLLTPTSFILSTHNTISAQIAVMLSCNGYNFTYVHSGISFESTLIDALMHFEEGDSNHILVGGIDEITKENYQTKAFNSLWRRDHLKISQLYKYKAKGCIPGESSTFAILSNQQKDKSYAKLIDVSTIYEANDEEIETEMHVFLSKHALTSNDIDVVLFGVNGDLEYDKSYLKLYQSNFNNKHLVSYKNVCGEHDSASSFAFWEACMIAKHQFIPSFIHQKKVELDKFKNILIYQYDFMHRNNHAFTLIQAL